MRRCLCKAWAVALDGTGADTWRLRMEKSGFKSQTEYYRSLQAALMKYILIFPNHSTIHPQFSMPDLPTQGTVQMILPLVTFFSISLCASWISSIL